MSNKRYIKTISPSTLKLKTAPQVHTERHLIRMIMSNLVNWIITGIPLPLARVWRAISIRDQALLPLGTPRGRPWPWHFFACPFRGLWVKWGFWYRWAPAVRMWPLPLRTWGVTDSRCLNGRTAANGAAAITAVTVTDWAPWYRTPGPASSASIPANRCYRVWIAIAHVMKITTH